jgi:hypothetical protein
MKNAKLTWKVASRVLVAHATEGVVDNVLYSRFIDALKKEKYEAYLATTTGSAELTSVQRKAASDALNERKIPTFVVTDSRLVRGIVTAASWLGVNAKPYSWADISEAVQTIGESLRLSDAEKQLVLRTVEDLKNANDDTST